MLHVLEFQTGRTNEHQTSMNEHHIFMQDLIHVCINAAVPLFNGAQATESSVHKPPLNASQPLSAVYCLAPSCPPPVWSCLARAQGAQPSYRVAIVP